MDKTETDEREDDNFFTQSLNPNTKLTLSNRGSLSSCVLSRRGVVRGGPGWARAPPIFWDQAPKK